MTADATVAVSPEDSALLERLTNRTIDVIPNAIELSDYPERPSDDARGPVALFPGTMDFRPNADAAIWFVERVLPIVRSRLHEFQCYIVGRNPKPELIRHGQRDAAIAVTGDVPSMSPYWNRAAICILPLQVGGGTRFKALEAMALGVPIVSTRLGMEGIEAAPGRDYLAADEPGSFAEAVTHLLQSPNLQRSLAISARRVVEDHYSQGAVNAALGRLYRRLGQS
jgi:glycosyltransferase involved in cell wall biosynthesis